MRKFEENNILEDSVKENNIEDIKTILIDTIMIFKGNKNEIQKAIDYVLNNSSFTFDPHDGRSFKTLNEDSAAYSIEGFNMLSNFSRERYDAMIDLYIEKYGNKYFEESVMLSENESNIMVNEVKEEPENDKKVLKILAYTAVALAAGYVLYKLVD